GVGIAAGELKREHAAAEPAADDDDGPGRDPCVHGLLLEHEASCRSKHLILRWPPKAAMTRTSQSPWPGAAEGHHRATCQCSTWNRLKRQEASLGSPFPAVRQTCVNVARSSISGRFGE